MRATPTVTIYSMAGQPNHVSWWTQTWTPSLSQYVHQCGAAANRDNYVMVTTQPNGTGPGEHLNINGTNFITSFDMTSITFGTYSPTTPELSALAAATPHYAWHVEASAEL